MVSTMVSLHCGDTRVILLQVLHDATVDKTVRKSRAEALLELGHIFTVCKPQQDATDNAKAAKQKMEDAVQLVAERRHAQAS